MSLTITPVLPMIVDITDDSISITDNVVGRELVYWDEQEWADDPSVTTAIARAIQLAHMNPVQLLCDLGNLEVGRILYTATGAAKRVLDTPRVKQDESGLWLVPCAPATPYVDCAPDAMSFLSCELHLQNPDTTDEWGY